MDRNDVIDLLAIVQTVDGREVTEPDVVVWHQMLGYLDRDDCLDAIMAHRREEPGVWLEPGHVVSRVRAKIRDRLDRADPDFERPGMSRYVGKFDKWGQIDKAAPDEEEYPAQWSPNERLKSYWAKIQGIRDEEERRMAFERPGALLASPPATQEVRAAAIREFAQSRMAVAADGVVEDVPHVNPLGVVCSFCQATEGEPCTMSGMPGLPRQPLARMVHPSRIEAAAKGRGFSKEVTKVIVGAAQRQQALNARSRWSAADAAIAAMQTFDKPVGSDTPPGVDDVPLAPGRLPASENS